MQKKKINLLYIEWCDAVTFNTGWENIEDILVWAKTENWVIRQAGFLIIENKEYVLLATKYNPQENSENKFSEITKIPKTWIRKRKTITSSYLV